MAAVKEPGAEVFFQRIDLLDNRAVGVMKLLSDVLLKIPTSATRRKVLSCGLYTDHHDPLSNRFELLNRNTFFLQAAVNA